jgi:hypothetical protein
VSAQLVKPQSVGLKKKLEKFLTSEVGLKRCITTDDGKMTYGAKAQAQTLPLCWRFVPRVLGSNEMSATGIA